jgi:Holliday junction DNA helicase RuvB
MEFKDFIGNEEAVEKLHLVASDALNARGKLPHLGFFGPPGCGKTSMARIVSSYVGRPFMYISCTAIKEISFFRNILNRHKNGAVVLLDECHRLPGPIQDNLLSVLEEPATLVSTVGGRIVYSKLPPGLSFILATTHEGNIRDALLSRLIKVEFHEYDVEQRSIIARNCLMGEHKFPHCDDEAVNTIGARSRSPREVVQNCNLVAMKARQMCSKTIDMRVVEEVFRILGVDQNGLTRRDHQILEYLTCFEFLGLKSLASYINMPEQDVMEKIEPWLLRNKLIVRLPRGRKITALGLRALEGAFVL